MRTALGDQGGAHTWFGRGQSAVPNGSSFRRASSLQARPAPYPNPSIQSGREEHRQSREIAGGPPLINSTLPDPSLAQTHQSPRQDVEMDPLLADVNQLMSSLSLEPTLPVPRAEFTNVPINMVYLMARNDDFINGSTFKDLVPDFIDRTSKIYHGECDGLHKALQALKGDAALYAQGKWPRPLQHRSGQQFKKEMKEEFDQAQKHADDKKAMDDFKRKIEATKQWVAFKAKELEAMTFISAKLGELYDKMLESQMRMKQNDMYKVRAHVVSILYAQMPEYMHKAAKKYADKTKNKEDSDKKKLDREQKFDELIQMYPKVALAVFFREMEERLITVCLARKEQVEQEYRRARRGQQLTNLEDQVYNMKAELQKNGLAHLDSRMTQIFQQSKSKEKGNKVGSGSRNMQNGSRRSSSSAPQHKHKNKFQNRARSNGKADKRSNSRKTHQRVTSASAQNRTTTTRTQSQASKVSQQSAKTSSTRGRSSKQRQRSANPSSKSRQSKSSARSMMSQRSFSRSNSRSKSIQSQQSSRRSTQRK